LGFGGDGAAAALAGTTAVETPPAAALGLSAAEGLVSAVLSAGIATAVAMAGGAEEAGAAVVATGRLFRTSAGAAQTEREENTSQHENWKITFLRASTDHCAR
jgi:hypothetical protein